MTRLLALSVIAYFSGTTWHDLKGKSRKEPCATARSWFQYTLHADAGISILSISRIVQRDHSNVRSSILRLQRRLDMKDEYDTRVHNDLSLLFAGINRVQAQMFDDEGWYYDDSYSLRSLGIIVPSTHAYPPNVPW